MQQQSKRRGNGNGGAVPVSRKNFLNPGFFNQRLSDFDNDLFEDDADVPLANILESEKEFQIDLNVPGMKREDFKVDVEDGVLTVTSKKVEKKAETGKTIRRQEFSSDNICRSFALPDNVDENNIYAKYDNGLLKVAIPKKEITPAKPKKEISVA